ncbi:serine/threonine-protein kinase Chk1-like [Oratosquilla oratoria]|uniref:serine/threonine-protein kinase Chk1-like n=1 Tax=Oratosquilla oratoria TaxID=337810 RepID=UPI003F76E358
MFFFRLFVCCWRSQESSKDLWSHSKDSKDSKGIEDRTKNSSGKEKSIPLKENGSRGSRKKAKTPTTIPVSPVLIFPPRELVERNKEQAKAHRSNNKWEDVKYLGVGSFGYVKLLKNVETEKFLAVKEVKCKTDSSEELFEAIIHSQLDHENVIKLFFWKKHYETLFMYLEYASGGSLGDLEGPLAEEDALHYFEQLMKGVEFLHSRGVIHRDLKPDNIFLTEERIVKIADLGLCSLYIWKGVEIYLSGFLGTQSYMAPELFTGMKYRGPPIDVWACGIILFNMLTAGHPWWTADPEDRNYSLWVKRKKKIFKKKFWNKVEGLSSWSLLKRLLAVDPEKRICGWRQLRHEEKPHQ